MRLSILIPIYNGGCLQLVRALASQQGLARTEAWEILVADDGSTDRKAIDGNLPISQIPHCRYIRRAENVGRAAIRNLLAREAQYERLIFIDGDMGVSDPHYIDRYIDAAGEDVIYGSYRLAGHHPDNLRYLSERSRSRSAAQRQRHPYQDFHTSNYSISRATALRYPLDEGYRGYGYEDVAYGRTLQQAGIGICHIDNPADFYDFETNGEYLRKTEESLHTLLLHADELAPYSRLLRTERWLRLAGLRWMPRLLLRLWGKRWRTRLASTHPSLTLLQLYKTAYMTTLRRTLTLLLTTLLTLTAAAQGTGSAYQTYISLYKDLAIEQMIRYRIPASITLAQGLLESGAGMSELARKGNNHFGIKCHNWTGATTYHDDDARGECFRAYRNVVESYEDHSRFLSGNSRYSRLFALQRTDYRGWARGLKACGYATNPRYAESLIGIIEQYALYQYDTASKYDKFIARHAGNTPAPQGNTRLHPIYLYNKNYYIYAREGDTFRAIGKEIGVSYRAIARYNERDKGDILHKGDIVYLKKKQKRATKEYKRKPHTVQPGESLYDIAQKYGIRLESLYKMNHLEADYQIRVGDKLRVR